MCQTGTQLPLPHFRPISVATKWLDRSRCHLVWRQVLAQATLCQMGTQPPKLSAHVYYSYCDFVRTLHKAQSLLVYSSSSSMVKLTCKFPTIQNVSLIVLEHYLLDLNWCRAITQCTHPVNVLTTKLGIKIVRQRIPTRRSVAFLQLWPKRWMDKVATW